MVWGWISAHGIRDLHICDDNIDAEAYVSPVYGSREVDIFSLELHVYFSRTTPELHSTENICSAIERQR